MSERQGAVEEDRSRLLPVVIDGLTAPEAFGRLVFAGRVIAEIKASDNATED